MESATRRAIEPAVYTLVDETYDNEEKKECGDDGKTHKGGNELGPELRTHNIALAFKKELYRVPQYEKDEKYEKYYIDIDEPQDENIGRYGDVSAYKREVRFDVD
jgi:hypothetical protein